MISIGVAQISNSVDVSKNFESIYNHLQKFENENVDLVLFPECSLSGFTSAMRDCTEAVLQPNIAKIQNWVNLSGIEVVLPTAVAEAEKGYKLAVLICYEMEHQAWTYFPNALFSNMSEWKIPILQSNFAYYDLNGQKGAGPEGLSFVINEKNELIHKASHLKAEGFVVQMNKVDGQTIVLKCSDL